MRCHIDTTAMGCLRLVIVTGGPEAGLRTRHQGGRILGQLRAQVKNHIEGKVDSEEGASRFEPQCWVQHRHHSEPAPIDLLHTLVELYRVRCNLLHGEKVASSEADQQVVGAALRVLVTFMRKGG